MGHLGEDVRPRVRFEDVPEPLRPSLAGLAGGYEEWGSSSDDFHAADWDLIVTFGSDATVRDSGHLHVLSFGAAEAYVRRMRPAGAGPMSTLCSLSYRGETHARFCFVPEDLGALPTGWRTLVKRSVADQFSEGRKTFWTGLATVSCTPLVMAGTGDPSGPVALLIEREPKPEGLVLLLPAESVEHASWLTMFIDLLRDRDPSAFPAPPDWRNTSEWAPVALQAALDADQSLDVERSRALIDFDRRKQEYVSAIRRELDVAARGQHRLLAAKGDELVDAVAEALRALGFQVRNMDSEPLADHSPRLEDMRVTDPERPGWELIAEVKGYAKGAKASDVQQVLQRPMWAYIEEHGHRPRGVWHIVNAWADTHPSTRPVALDKDPSVLQLSEADGALIDTRDVFKAVRAVESGQARATSLREAMRSARGRWEFQTEDELGSDSHLVPSVRGDSESN